MHKYHFIFFLITSWLISFGENKIPVLILDDYLKNIALTYNNGVQNVDKCIEKIKPLLDKNPTNPILKFDLAVLCILKENYVKSIIHLEEAIEIKRKQKDTADICTYLRLLGLGYTSLKYYDKSLHLLNICAKRYASDKEYTALMLTFTNIASLYVNKGNNDSAFAFYYKALEISNVFPSYAPKSTKRLTQVGLCYLHGVTQHYDSCHYYFRKTLSDTSVAFRIKYAAYLYVVPALIHHQLLDTALHYFEQSERFFFDSGMYRVTHQTYPLIMPAYIAKKQYDKILFYQKRWKICVDSNMVRMDKIALQKIDVERITQEKLLVQKELYIKNVKLSQKNTTIFLLVVSLLLLFSVGFNYYHRLNLRRTRETELFQRQLNEKLQQEHELQGRQLELLQENKKLQDFIQTQLEEEVRKRTEELVQKEKEIIALKEKEIQAKVEKAELEALTQSLLIQQKNQIFEQVKTHIEGLKGKNLGVEEQKSLKDLILVIKNSLNIEHQWENFKIHFEANYPMFMQKITEKYSNLSENEIRHLAYIKIGLSIKEVADLLGIEPNSVKIARYRIKQKLGMTKEDSLSEKVKNM